MFYRFEFAAVLALFLLAIICTYQIVLRKNKKNACYKFLSFFYFTCRLFKIFFTSFFLYFWILLLLVHESSFRVSTSKIGFTQESISRLINLSIIDTRKVFMYKSMDIVLFHIFFSFLLHFVQRFADCKIGRYWSWIFLFFSLLNLDIKNIYKFWLFTLLNKLIIHLLHRVYTCIDLNSITNCICISSVGYF